MIDRYQPLFLLLVAAALVVTGCDQSSQRADPENANRYIISQNSSAAGDAATGSFSGTNAVQAPDTVDYYVQGYTVNKDYTWTVNGNELSSATSSDESYVWESRGGEFISVVYGEGGVTTMSGTNSITVNAADDDIDAETIEVSTQLPATGGQVARFGGFSTVANLAASSNIAKLLNDEGSSFTLFAPSNSALAAGDDPAGALGAAPTQAFDPDEDTTSTVRADILKYHAIQDSLASEDLPANNVETLLGNTTVTVTSDMVKQSDIPASNGVIHRLNTPLLPPTASVDFTDRALADTSVTQGDTLMVDGLYIPEGGGYIVLHDKEELETAGAVASTVGVSEYIEGPGVVNGVKVALDEDLTDDVVTLGAMPHQETNGNESYDFIGSSGPDGPYTLEGEPVIDFAEIDVQDTSSN
mgnify:CR=1 FL=1